jgi:hypothetical protein
MPVASKTLPLGLSMTGLQNLRPGTVPPWHSFTGYPQLTLAREPLAPMMRQTDTSGALPGAAQP